MALHCITCHSEHTQTCTFENHTNLLACLANWPQFTPENGSQRAMLLNAKVAPFLGFTQVFSALIVRENCQKQAPTKTQLCVYTVDYWSNTCVGTSTIHLCSIQSSLPFSLLLRHSYVTHVIDYTRSSPAFPYCKRWKAERGLETRLVLSYYTTQC